MGVFATPLELVIKNDRLTAAGVHQIPRQSRRKSEPTTLSAETREKVLRKRRASAHTAPTSSGLKRQDFKQQKSFSTMRKNSASSLSLRSAGSSQDGGESKHANRHSDSDSFLISDLYQQHGVRTNVGWKSRLLDALTLYSTSASASCLLEKPELPIPCPPQVPSIVIQSIKYLEKHGK